MKSKIGKTISYFRKKAGLTQKELADKLFVSDKAVSKWERGLSYPDVTYISKLSKILDIDTDALFIEEDKSIVSNWCGILYLPNGVNSIKFSNKVEDKFILEIIICYYLLVSINNIFIICDGENFKFAIKFIKKFGQYKINIKVINVKRFSGKFRSNLLKGFTDIMLIYDLFFIYGVGLTSSFQRAMIDKSTLVTLFNPRIPLIFGQKNDVLNMIDTKDYSNNVTILNLFNGYMVIYLNSIKNVNKCSKLMNIIESVIKYKLYSAEEIIKIRQI